MKCNKVKNACKICFETVTHKNGIQCQGACKKWAHFTCLNYTPGKIQDIKKGVIKVTCPCPDCSTAYPKEVLTNPPFSCTNQKCPANVLPKCESQECPSNKPSLQSACPPSPPCIKPRSAKHKPRPNSSSSSASECKGPCSPPSTSSDEDTSGAEKAQLMQTLGHMCNTIGQLSKQLQELMCNLDNK